MSPGKTRGAVREQRLRETTAAYARIAERMGRAPTISEVAEALNLSDAYVSELLRAAGLPRGGPGRSAPKYAPEEIRAAHHRLSASLGRAPQNAEMASALSVSPNTASSYCARLGLPLISWLELHSKSEAGDTPKKKKAALTSAERSRLSTQMRRERAEKKQDFGGVDSELHAVRAARMMRYDALCRAGDPEKRPKTLRSASEGYGASERLLITCPMCGERAWIVPRMHPWYARNRAGEVIWLCGRRCMVSEDYKTI